MGEPIEVLIVDDSADDEYVRNLRKDLDEGGVSSDSKHPQEVDAEDLAKVHLVLVDYDLGDWTSEAAPEAPLGMCPSHGVALTAVLRGHARETAPPTGFALLTGKIGDVAPEMPPSRGRHSVARWSGLEWVFEKDETDLVARIGSLGEAIRDLPNTLFEGGASDLAEYLKAPSSGDDATYSEALIDSLRFAQPPLHDLNAVSHSLAVVRWMLHRVLPYPSLLIDELHLARRLRVSAQTITREVGEGGKLGPELKDAEYVGPLCQIAGRRWWRREVDALLWTMTEGQASSPRAIHAALGERGVTIEPYDGDPVVLVDGESFASSELSTTSECVRIVPDEWPSSADPAWMRLEDVMGDSMLQQLVHPDDLDRLGEHGE